MYLGTKFLDTTKGIGKYSNQAFSSPPPGFPTGVENMGGCAPLLGGGGSSKCDGGGLSQYMGGAWGA